jgi:hypothetical protein
MYSRLSDYKSNILKDKVIIFLVYLVLDYLLILWLIIIF